MGLEDALDFNIYNLKVVDLLELLDFQNKIKEVGLMNLIAFVKNVIQQAQWFNIFINYVKKNVLKKLNLKKMLKLF